MKKIASRVLALVVALSMLLVPGAFAAERNAATLTIGNFEVVMGEQTISLPVYLAIGGGVDIEGARGYMTAGVSTETASALSALAAFENGEIKAYLNGMNYGFTIPLEQVIELLEAEMGMTLEEAMTMAMSEASAVMDEETMAAFTGLMESAAALESVDVDIKDMLKALNVSWKNEGKTTVTLFDVETEASEITFEMKPQTYKALFDALADLDPALNAYLTEYFAMLNETMAATGEEMTIEEAFEMITVGVTGTVYNADETGALIDLVASVSVEDETIEIPANVVVLADEAGVYMATSMLMDVDGEMVYFEIYADDYTAEGADLVNFSVSAAIGDVDAEENDAEFVFSFSTQNSEAGPSVGADIYVDSYGDVVSAGFLYMGAPVVSTEAADSYDGLLMVYGEMDGMAFEASADTNLTLTNVPEGELLTFTQSVNPLEADEETMAQISTDAMNALIQGAGVLMQDPTLAGMLGSLMG